VPPTSACLWVYSVDRRQFESRRGHEAQKRPQATPDFHPVNQSKITPANDSSTGQGRRITQGSHRHHGTATHSWPTQGSRCRVGVVKRNPPSGRMVVGCATLHPPYATTQPFKTHLLPWSGGHLRMLACPPPVVPPLLIPHSRVTGVTPAGVGWV